MVDVRRIIARKRDDHTLSDSEIRDFVSAVTKQEATRAQAAAFLSFVYAHGLTPKETASLTMAMADSGRRLLWSKEKPLIDKHSTGGVGGA